MFIVLLFLLLLLFRSNTRRVGRDGKNWNREAGTLFTFWAPLEKLNLLRRTGERIVNYYGNHSTCSRNSCTFVLFMLMQWFNFLEWDFSFFEGEFTILLKFSLFFFFFFCSCSLKRNEKHEKNVKNEMQKKRLRDNDGRKNGYEL